MEKERKIRIIILSVSVVAILSLSIGFAGWTTQLSISDVDANIVNGADIESFSNLITVSNITCDDKSTDASVKEVGLASAHSWTGTKVILTKPGDYVMCSATVTNSSVYIAYLDDIRINGIIQCSGNGQNVQNACDALKLTVFGEGTNVSTATVQGTNVTNATDIFGNYIDSDSTGIIKLKMEYAGTDLSDTDFIATMPAITFDYSTVD